MRTRTKRPSRVTGGRPPRPTMFAFTREKAPHQKAHGRCTKKRGQEPHAQTLRQRERRWGRSGRNHGLLLESIDHLLNSLGAAFVHPGYLERHEHGYDEYVTRDRPAHISVRSRRRVRPRCRPPPCHPPRCHPSSHASVSTHARSFRGPQTTSRRFPLRLPTAPWSRRRVAA